MKHEQLVDGLKRLYLRAMARDYYETARQCEGKSKTYEQYLAQLVELELNSKTEIKIKRLIRQAELPREKTIDGYRFGDQKGINQKQVNRLAEGDFLREAKNIVFYGTFGVGKSHLAEGVTRALCEKGYRCLFKTTHAFIDELIEAQKSLTLTNHFKRLDRYDLITLDELGYCPHSKEGANLFFQFISQRYERRSIMVTTNLTYSEWGSVFQDPITTAAAVDRVIHKCETFNISGPSWRAEEAKENQKMSLKVSKD